MEPALPSFPPLSIADIERDTGLRKDTLRIWERRYGFPLPIRDAYGERRYDEAQLRRLRLIKRLLDVGYRPGHIVPLEQAALERLATAQSPRQRRGAARTRDLSGPPATLAAEWMAWLQHNQAEALRQGLHLHLLRHGLAHTIESLIAPLGIQVGQAWYAGHLSVFQEHLFSEIVQSVLREAITAMNSQPWSAAQRPRVLLTTLPPEQHVQGLLMAECFFALQGCERFALGACTPLPDIADAVRQLDVDIVALSFSAHVAATDIAQGLRQLAVQLPPDVQVWVGGSATALHQARRLPHNILRLHRAEEVSAQVERWRGQRAARA